MGQGSDKNDRLKVCSFSKGPSSHGRDLGKPGMELMVRAILGALDRIALFRKKAE